MATPKKNLVAVTPGGEITKDMIVGHYFWFNTPEEDRPEITIRKEWKAAGLPEDRLPRKRQDKHVAQLAVRSVEGDASNGVKREVVVNQINTAGTQYQVTLRIWDAENAVIEHEKSMRVTFSAGADDPFLFEALSSEADQLAGVEQRIRDYFAEHGNRLPGHKMRTIVRHMLEDAGAENMSESGRSSVYFITQEHEPLLKATGQFLANVYNGKRGHTKGALHNVEVINSAGQREMLKRKFVENCDEELKAYRDRLMDLVRQQSDRKRGFRTDLLGNLQDQRKAMTEKVDRFKALLSDELGELDQGIALADKALGKLLSEADVA